MGKSTVSCFKIISCGSDTVDHDDLQTPDTKGSSDRRGWSFRKRSARHRILNNSVNSEAPSSANKENPESTAVNFQVQPDITVPEKTSAVQWAEEKFELSAQVDSKLSDAPAAKEDDCTADATLDESSIIVIQAAIRGLLAQQVLLKQKNIIKLQAAVRGHLVRRHAVGTLRCVQAIIKMQGLVRARRTRLLVEGSGDISEQSQSSGKDNKRKKETKPNGTYTYASIEKLLSNAFARQLMESTPRTQAINIKCDPLKSDSAWNWLERWMSVSSASNEEPHKSGSDAEQHKDNAGHFDDKDDSLVPTDCYSESTDLESVVLAPAEASDKDGNLISNDSNNLDSHSNKSISPSSSHSMLANIDQSNSICDETESAPIETNETDLVEVVDVKPLPRENETVNKEDIPDSEEVSTEQSGKEAKKLSRKSSNPSFIAAQSKFEELSLATPSANLATPSSHEPEVESSLDKVYSSTGQPSRDMDLADNVISNASAAQIGGSECGTEISISSTLDSPDRSDAGVGDIGKETKVPDEPEHPRSRHDFEPEANGKSIELETDLSYTDTNKLKCYESINATIADSLDSVGANSPQLEMKSESDPRDVQLELGSEASHLANKSSPEASPRSHITITESQATPSSQVSIKPEKSKGEKSESSRKNRTSSADKNLSSRSRDSTSRNSLEQLQEHKSAKRRNSFGSAKLDQREQEPRDSSSSSSLPSYMQATESARAKAIANSSPRSSPDVHEKDIYIKKRHSLPGSNERQGSPRIQRSPSQAQPNAKGNATNSPQDTSIRPSSDEVLLNKHE